MRVVLARDDAPATMPLLLLAREAPVAALARQLGPVPLQLLELGGIVLLPGGIAAIQRTDAAGTSERLETGQSIPLRVATDDRAYPTRSQSRQEPGGVSIPRI